MKTRKKLKKKKKP